MACLLALVDLFARCVGLLVIDFVSGCCPFIGWSCPFFGFSGNLLLV